MKKRKRRYGNGTGDHHERERQRASCDKMATQGNEKRKGWKAWSPLSAVPNSIFYLYSPCLCLWALFFFRERLNEGFFLKTRAKTSRRADNCACVFAFFSRQHSTTGFENLSKPAFRHIQRSRNKFCTSHFQWFSSKICVSL